MSIPTNSDRPLPRFLADVPVPVVAAPMLIGSTTRLVAEDLLRGRDRRFPP